MGKVIMLILFALGAKANAEDTLSLLVDRASNHIEGIEIDLDEATLAKPAKASGGAKKTVAAAKTVRRTTSSTSKRGAVGPRKGTFTPIKGNSAADRTPKKLFGGTNTLMAGKGQAIQEGAAVPSYWGGKKADKGLGYGWFAKAKAVPDAQTPPFMAQPVAPRLGLARPQIGMGARPMR
jgi:hypothetical protein